MVKDIVVQVYIFIRSGGQWVVTDGIEKSFEIFLQVQQNDLDK